MSIDIFGFCKFDDASSLLLIHTTTLRLRTQTEREREREREREIGGGRSGLNQVSSWRIWRGRRKKRERETLKNTL